MRPIKFKYEPSDAISLGDTADIYLNPDHISSIRPLEDGTVQIRCADVLFVIREPLSVVIDRFEEIYRVGIIPLD